jgi:hemoglobin/transferrin/lactoferrin receptor protein
MFKQYIFTALLSAAFLFAPFAQVFSQIVMVRDSSTFEPLSGVLIANADKSKSVVTDELGKASLAIFGEEEGFLTFTHVSFANFSISKEDLKKSDYRVFLLAKSYLSDAVFVSANRWEEDWKSIPNQISRVDAKTIAMQNPQTMAEVMGLTGNVFVQKSQAGGGSPMFRGFNANSVLIVVDGVRMNNCIFRAGNVQSIIQLDAGSVQSAEVLFGPSSVMYGSDALGGVMDIHLKSPRFSTDRNLKVSGSAFTRYSSANSEKTGHLDISIAGRKWASMTSVTYTDFDDTQVGRNRPSGTESGVGLMDSVVIRDGNRDRIVANPRPYVIKNSGYSQINLMQKFAFRLSENVNLEYGFHYSTSSDVPRNDRLFEKRNGRLRFAEWYYGPQKWMMNVAKLHIGSKNQLFDFARITAARQDYEESRYSRNRGNDWRGGRIDGVAAYSLNADFEKKIGKNHFYYGLEYLYNVQNSTASQVNVSTGEVKPLDTRYPSGGSTWRNAAAYLNWQHHLSEKITLAAGGRFTSTRVFSKFSDKTFYNFPFDDAEVKGNALTGSASVIYRPDEKTKISVLGSSGFRTPNVDDVGKIFERAPGTVVVPNPNLKPEYTYNAELGFARNFGGKFFFSGNVYYTLVKSLIVQQDGKFEGKDSIVYDGNLAKVVTLGNSSEGSLWGYSVEAKYFVTDKISLSSNLNYAFGRDKETNLTLKGVVPMFGRTMLEYKLKRFDFALSAKYMAKSVKFSEMGGESASRAFMHGTAERVPAWHTFNFRMQYRISDYVHANFGIENIFDRYFTPQASGFPEPGRNFIFALRGNF